MIITLNFFKVKIFIISRPKGVPCLCSLPIIITLLLQHQDPVVQSIVSLTISLRHKFVKQISAKVTNTLKFFVEKM